MIGYASRTGTKKNLAGLKAAGWRLMLSAKGVLRTEGFKYALDNGAWWAFANQQPFDEMAFMKAYDLLAEGADFVVVPDIVGGGKASLEMSLAWLQRLDPAPCPLMLAVQDGIESADVMPLVGPNLGIFVGGSTEWKLGTMISWGEVARQTGATLHIGRVNSAKRIHMCEAAGADSFDGSGASKYAVVLQGLEVARQQRDLFSVRERLGAKEAAE